MFVLCFFKQKTAYEMRISDWSSDVCSSDLAAPARQVPRKEQPPRLQPSDDIDTSLGVARVVDEYAACLHAVPACFGLRDQRRHGCQGGWAMIGLADFRLREGLGEERFRSEEHTSELQSLMRISYAVFCLKQKKVTSATQSQR